MSENVEETDASAFGHELLFNSVIGRAICGFGVDGKVLSWNDGAACLMGYDRREILGEHFSRFFLVEDQESIAAKALEAAKREGVFCADCWQVRKDGSRFWASISIGVVLNERSEVIGFTKTTRGMLEKQFSLGGPLRTQRAGNQRLVERLSDCAVFHLDPDGAIASWMVSSERAKS